MAASFKPIIRLKGALTPPASSSSSSSQQQQHRASTPDVTEVGTVRRARGPLGLIYTNRGAWYPLPPAAAPAVEQGKKRKSIVEENDLLAPREFRQVLFSPWNQHTLRSMGITQGMQTSRRLEPWQERWVEIVKEYSNVVAVCCSDSVTLLRLGPQEPYKVKVKIAEPEDEIYCVAWSFDPVRLTPLIAFAGKKGLIYVWRLSTGAGEATERFRVLRGHGEEIYSLKFHPRNPHILVSTSLDTTSRIWNILGSEPPAGAYKVPATAHGNEGKVVVAIYAGQMPGGHAEGVTAVDFHPTLPLLVTGGLDYVLKIWPVPRLPPPVDKSVDHRTFVCFHPLFSSRYFHDGYVNGVEWHGEDTLLSYQNAPKPRIVKWRWLGLRRHFPKDANGKVTIRYGEHSGKGGLEAINSQYATNTAKSYEILNVYSTPTSEVALLPSEPLLLPLRPPWFSTFAHLLPPTPNPSSSNARNEVSTSLVGMPIRGGKLCLWNPDTETSTAFQSKEYRFKGGSKWEEEQEEAKDKEFRRARMNEVERTQVKLEQATDESLSSSMGEVKVTHPSRPPKPVNVGEPYTVADLMGNGEEEEELTSLTVSPGGGKWLVGSSARGVHIWSLPL